MSQWNELKKSYLTGWKTWENESMLAHVLFPQGAILRLGVYDKKRKEYALVWLEDCYQMDAPRPVARPYAHSYTGDYTRLTVEWEELRLNVETSCEGENLLVRVTPESKGEEYLLLIQADELPEFSGEILDRAEGFAFRTEDWQSELSATVPLSPMKLSRAHVLAAELSAPVGICVGQAASLGTIDRRLQTARQHWEENKQKYGDCAELYNAMQTCMAWDTIYYPPEKDVFSPVARSWSKNWNGYVLFCWDTFFAANMAAVDHKELAYLNLYAIASRVAPDGFVPNFAAAPKGSAVYGVKSCDRSQPPVGSSVALRIYQKYGEAWILEEIYPYLKRWNEWWIEKRLTKNNLLTWGSDPFRYPDGALPVDDSVDTWQGAAFESGLDNSPMYDDIPFDRETHRFLYDDAGLNGLYIEDCRALAEIARILGKEEDSAILTRRCENFEDRLEELWDDTVGMYCNRRTDTGEFSHRYSPTNFYTLFSSKVPSGHVERMLQEHFYNPEEFYGEYILPSIARNDPAYPDQNYWRGRIWAPMNFLVYLALRKQGCTQAQKDLAEKSVALLLPEWLEEGHIHENYNADTGDGDDVQNSNSYYHWGALLSLIQLMEKGYF